jgi:2-octaprenyl-3-methyl-6-methoxy-1,4-benzoquinol hydroxylase/2-octaprenylphenol hydroxylase
VRGRAGRRVGKGSDLAADGFFAAHTDNGTPFSGRFGISALSVWWIKLGIRPERIQRGKPTQNGRHERIHRTLKADAIQRGVAYRIYLQQRVFDRFRHEYNTERPHEATAWQRFLSTGPLALLPLADGRSSLVWSLPEVEAQRVLALDDQSFLDELGLASDFRLGLITGATPRAAFPLKLQLAERYQADRFVLLGDAAHAVHPLAGQGVNLGLRDVVELRDTLVAARAAGRDIGAAHVLRQYARRRRSADTLDALGFDALARIYAWQSPALVAARGLGVRLLDRFAPLKRRIAGHAAGL